jgi:hypothetical protein
MSDLRTAAQQALEALEFMADEWGFTQKANRPERWQAIDALKAALAQPEQPEQPEQEPVAHVKVRPLQGNEWQPKVEITWVSGPFAGPLYTHPPRREWRSLSEEEIDAIQWHGSPFQFARAIEAALRSKNHE